MTRLTCAALAAFGVLAWGAMGADAPAKGSVDPLISQYMRPDTAGTVDPELRRLGALEERTRTEDAVRERQYIKTLLELADKIEADARKHDSWIRSTGGMDGLGEIERLRIRAQYFAFEKQYREQLQRDTVGMVANVRAWIEFRDKARSNDRILELERRVVELERKKTEDVPPPAITSFELYTVTKPMTLRQISELPDVYGDSTMWKAIFDANKSRVSDADRPVSAGVTLVVPRLERGQGAPNLN